MSITPGRRTPGRRRVTLVPMAALAAIALLAAGCGSSGRAAAAAARRAANSSDSSVSAAQQLLDKYSARPTAITQTTPIKKPIPTGKKITFISCGVEACAVQGPILQQGAKTLGLDGHPGRHGRLAREGPERDPGRRAKRRRTRSSSTPPM